jgi:mevalonate kinase
LLGEHAVVYGVPAIAAGIERGAHARAALTRGASRLQLAGETIETTTDTELGRAFEALLDELGQSGVEVTVELTMPAGVGLGASAAIGVAVARAVYRLYTRDSTGEGSSIEHLVLPSPLELVVAIAGPPASTRAMVEGVRAMKERQPEVFDKTIEAIRTLVKNARLALQAGDGFAVGRLFDLNQMLLAGLFVSTESIEHACRVARDAGASGAKLTGAGGGGCVIALPAKGESEHVLAAWRAEGFECFSTTVRSRA